MYMKYSRWLSLTSAVVALSLSAYGFLPRKASKWSSTVNGVSQDRTRDSQSFALVVSMSRSEAISSHQRVNMKVRSIMNLLTSQYNNDNPSMWAKTRNYVYHASNKLTVSQVIEVLEFLESTFPNDNELVRHILCTSPRILRKNVKNNLHPTAAFLIRLWGPALFREAVTRNPNLLLSSGLGHDAPENVEIITYLKSKLNLRQKQIDKLKRTSPFLFALPTTKMTSVMNFFEGILSKGGISEESIPGILSKIILTNPNILNLCVDTNLRFRIDFLKDLLALNETDMARLIKTDGASIFELSVDANLRPTLDFLSGVIQNKKELRKCVLSHPQLLRLSLKNLRSKVAYFDAVENECLGEKTKPSLAARVALRCPAVYSLSLNENIIPKVEFLARIWGCRPPRVRSDVSGSSPEIKTNRGNGDKGNMQNPSLSSLLKEYPTILSLSLEGNIQPTINFYNRTGYTVLTEDWNLVRSSGKNVFIRGLL